MHPDEGVLEALLDNELDSAAAAEAQRHLETCGECRDRLEDLRREADLLTRALQSLDRSTPPIPVTEIIARARGQRRLARWAAVVVLLLVGAGALYAMPGSPLRRWLDHLTGKRPAVREEADTSTAAAGGIALQPGARFRIVFERPGSARITGGSATVTLTDESTIEVQRLGGAARFAAGIDELRIETGDAPATFEIRLPRTAAWVAVLLGDRQVFLKDGPRVVTDTRPDSLGRYLLPLAERR